MFPETDKKTAHRVAERLKEGIENIKINGIAVTCSFGIAESSEARNLEELIQKADEALYSAKRAGKNSIAVSA
ncbi:hypothetical protein TST_0691 [Thermosulfidibacter takaii ABI70S6]|uniref:diguanylate cyclase n=1 Tax=Thermosulfidibacter takaii (strain DSM 17441 / JCM 13301 / NBRC 103674 / ABI70S6) TaxID=1298851 RepID=A0A0S3QT33_THET7|nr:hypothetical protein TST_0691 [Thermosulfidibacter takaii ABI70S6]